ncbi:trans-aconitate 2-methyltransferase [Niveomyces insectorum RCEF 264]|uniref:Trans-aconitate 2-methyltransferase n=1 Tax=Niveomyces insectorum RCEF 264 TaxID=1081102 RepID=A0A167VQ54_9HYPO|nr:trans-aconitate 2-methyltransferase [Niveomyces insectorum RCEF 264]
MTALRLSRKALTLPLRSLGPAAHTTTPPLSLFARTLLLNNPNKNNTPVRTMASAASKDWSADQYLKFHDERTRAVHDLVARVPLPGGRFPSSGPAAAAAAATESARPLRIVDLGCGPGNSTAVLAQRFPGASLAGVDSSPNMLAAARVALPGVSFEQADLRTYDPAAATTNPDTNDGGTTAVAAPPGSSPDLLFANAVLQWLPLADRLPTVLRLLGTLRPGGVVAYQVPDNLKEPAQTILHAVATGAAPGTADGRWVPYLEKVHARDGIETPEAIYDALVPYAASVDLWHTVYYHVLAGGVGDIVEWLKGTGLQPYLHALPDDEAIRREFLAAFETHLAEVYRPQVDGSVIIHYPRLFVVAVKK